MTDELNPYASPTASSGDTLLKFRSSLPLTFCMIFIYALLGTLLTGLFQTDLKSVPDTLLSVVPRLALYVLVLSIALVWLLPVYVSSKGIRSYTLWGNYDTVAWEGIDRVRAINLLGLRYVRLYSTSIRRPIWIPLFLARMKEFVTEVRARTSLDHPLNEYFASYSTNRTSSK